MIIFRIGGRGRFWVWVRNPKDFLAGTSKEVSPSLQTVERNLRTIKVLGIFSNKK